MDYGDKPQTPSGPFLRRPMAPCYSAVDTFEGDFNTARNHYQSALVSIKSRLGDRHPDVAVVLSNLSSVYQAQGKHSEALRLVRQAIDIQKDVFGEDHPSVAISMTVEANLYYEDGDLAKAAALSKRSLAILRHSYRDESPLVAGALANLGEIQRLSGDFEAAGHSIVEAQNLYRRLQGDAHPNVIRLEANIGTLALEQNRADDARHAFERAVSGMAEVFGRRHPSLASYHVGLSRARELAGDLDGALAASRAAVLVLRDRFFAVEAKRAVDALADINGRRVTFLRHLELIERVAAGRGRPISKSLLNESFEIGQLARGSRTARSLARMAARFAAKDGELLRLVRQRQRAVDAWQRFEEQIVSALSGLGPKKDFGQGALVALRDRQRAPERDIQRLDGRLLNDFPRYAEVINPVPLSIDLTQAYLKPGEALLSTFFGERRGFVWVITASQSRFIPIEASAEDLLLLGSEIRLGLDPFAGAQLTPQGLPATFPARHAFELFVLLFGGARDLLADIRTLYVVADGALQSLPLSVLLTEKPRAESFGIGDFAGAPWLAKKFGIATLPAETSLRALRGDARISQADKPFLGVGDPILANHPGAKHGAPLSDTIAARGVNGGRAGRTLFRGDLADVAVLKKIPSLPETAEELRLMAKALKAGPDALVLGENATEKNLKTTIDWKRYHTISFATHGLVSGDLQGFSEPALVLTPLLRASTLDDGLLTASEISNLDLDADWVILSACNTVASDDSSGGEGLSGLAQAFIYAGARSMFVSHWAVMSKPTVRLTTEMLQLLKSGNALAKTEAHRQAMLALLEDTENPYYAHPTIWAPFVIVGEGGLVRQ